MTYLYGGLAIWDHEPANRTGGLMTAVGLAWFIGTIAHSEIPVVNELGLGLEDTATVLLLALVLAYPSGRLSSMIDRAAVVILAVGATGLNVLFSTSLFRIDPGPTGLYGGLALATMTIVVIVRRWLIAPPRVRRELVPVLVAGLVFVEAISRLSNPPDVKGAGVLLNASVATAFGCPFEGTIDEDRVVRIVDTYREMGIEGITLADAGGPLEFVSDAETGFVSEPEPRAIAEAFDRLGGDRDGAIRMGKAGNALIRDVVPTWPEVVSRLLD